jgi:hypothetical protein
VQLSLRTSTFMNPGPMLDLMARRTVHTSL